MNRPELIVITRYFESIMEQIKSMHFTHENKVNYNIEVVCVDDVIQILSRYKDMLDELYEDSVV